VTTLVQAFAGILLPSTLVLLLILCNDKHLLGPLTNGRLLNVTAITAITIVLALSTLLTITSVLPGLNIAVALTLTIGLLSVSGAALVASHLRTSRPHPAADALTPWERQTWSAPTLELVTAPTTTRPRILALAILRGYILMIAALLLLKLVGVLPA
jgi:hypothetical protein